MPTFRSHDAQEMQAWKNIIAKSCHESRPDQPFTALLNDAHYIDVRFRAGDYHYIDRRCVLTSCVPHVLTAAGQELAFM